MRVPHSEKGGIVEKRPAGHGEGERVVNKLHAVVLREADEAVEADVDAVEDGAEEGEGLGQADRDLRRVDPGGEVEEVGVGEGV